MSEKKVIVYCVNNHVEYIEMAMESIRGIRHFNNSIPIIILTTHKFSIHRFLVNLKIKVIKTPPLFNRFPADKCIVGRVNFENVLLLDADTFVLGDIESLFEASEADIDARLSYRYSQNWEEKYDLLWRINNAKLGIPNGPIVNSGVVVFRNYSHKKLFNIWADIIKKFYKKELNEVYSGEWMFEQLALSMSIAKLNLQISILDKKFHSFGWIDSEFNDKNSIIIHTNNAKYHELRGKLIKQKRIK